MTSPSPLPSGTAEQHATIIAKASKNVRYTKPSELIWRMLEDATAIVDGMPDSEARFLRQGKGSTWRVGAGLTFTEARAIERLRTLSGISASGVSTIQTERGLEDVLLVSEWIRWCISTKDGIRLAKAASLLAQGDRKQLALSTWRPGRPYDRRELHRLRQRITDTILSGLKNQFQIDLRTIAT